MSRATPGDGNKAWEELLNEYAPNNGVHTLTLVHKLNTIKPTDMSARALYQMVCKIDEILGECRLCDQDVNMCEKLASARVCTVLPAHFASIVDRATQGAPWADVSRDIKRLASNMSVGDSAPVTNVPATPEHNITTAQAYAVSSRFHPYQGQGRGGTQGSQLSFRMCYFCGERGHVMMNCLKFKQYNGRPQQKSSSADKEANFAAHDWDLATMEAMSADDYELKDDDDNFVY